MSNETTKRNQKTKEAIKKELDETIVNGERQDNTETEEKARAVEKPENAATVIREFEQIIRSKSKNII